MRIGKTTSQKVSKGEQPSIVAASSMPSGTVFIKPVNIKTESPAPKPRYMSIIPSGLSRCKTFAVFDIVNITI